MEHHNSFNGNRLREAREFTELTQSRLASEIDVHRQTISAIEKNQQNPSYETILRLSKALNFPIDFFFDNNEDVYQRLSAITFRSKSTSTKRKKLKAELYDKWLNEIIHYLMQYIEFPEHKRIIDEEVNYKRIDREGIEELAEDIRNKLEIGNAPISNIVNLLEGLGIFLGITNLPEQIDAFSTSYAEFSNIMMNFTDDKAVRTNFNLAHELGHLLLHEYIDDNEYIENFDKIEKQANLFASSFLLPRQSFVKEYFSSDITHLLRMKQRWKVSMQAIVMRAKDLKLISSDQCSNIFRRLSYAGYRKKEPLDDQIEVNKPNLLKKSIELLIDNNVVTKEKLLKQINIPPSILASLVNLEENYFSLNENIVDFNLKLKLGDST
jgi:Zn-dependent peptidase ImmA (M78 family)/DNA-binding XRE family transcriptional regulator